LVPLKHAVNQGRFQILPRRLRSGLG
jgi:hypothetical protein